LIHGQGLLREADILDLAVNLEVANKSGAWYSYAGEKLGQGFEASIKYLKENPKIANKMETEVRKTMSTGGK